MSFRKRGNCARSFCTRLGFHGACDRVCPYGILAAKWLEPHWREEYGLLGLDSGVQATVLLGRVYELYIRLNPGVYQAQLASEQYERWCGP